MKIYCTPEFKTEYDKIIRKKSYQTLPLEIIECYFNKKYEDCLEGTRLNGHSETPYIKKRIGGSGGFRLYLLAIIKKDHIIFSFIHPKTGTHGIPNISTSKKTEILKTTIHNIKSDNLLLVKSCPENKNLVFETEIKANI